MHMHMHMNMYMHMHMHMHMSCTCHAHVHVHVHAHAHAHIASYMCTYKMRVRAWRVSAWVECVCARRASVLASCGTDGDQRKTRTSLGTPESGHKQNMSVF